MSIILDPCNIMRGRKKAVILYPCDRETLAPRTCLAASGASILVYLDVSRVNELL